MRDDLGFPNTGCTMHSPRNWFPSCAVQLGWVEEQLCKLGRWEPGSKMPHTYDRTVCTAELLMRNSILEKINSQGWPHTPEFEVPNMDRPPPIDATLKQTLPESFFEKVRSQSKEDVNDEIDEEQSIIDETPSGAAPLDCREKLELFGDTAETDIDEDISKL